VIKSPSFPHSSQMLVLLALFASSGTAAQSPTYIPIQGYLTDHAGVPLDGEQSLELELFAAAEGGEALYAETHTNVVFDAGRFEVRLGEGTARASNAYDWGPALFTVHGARWLHVVVGTTEAIEPRFALDDVPSAVKAEQASDVVPGGALDERLKAIEARLSAVHYVGRIANFVSEGRCVVDSGGTFIHDCYCDAGYIPVAGGAYAIAPRAVQDSKPHYSEARAQWAWRVGCIDTTDAEDPTTQRAACRDVSYWCVPFAADGPIGPAIP